MSAVAGYVTERVLASIDAGTAPWSRPWHVDQAKNLVSKKPYRGINVWLLDYEKAKHKYSSDWWLTFNQARASGGSVKPGSKSAMVVFWKISDHKDGCGCAKCVSARAETGARGKLFMLRYYKVFNADCVTGIKVPEAVAKTKHQPIPECEAVLKRWLDFSKVKYGHGGDRACYSPVLDEISMPDLDKFKGPEYYYTTAFHESVHSTGHKSRLDRLDNRGGGMDGYSREELIAEIGAAMLNAKTGIDTRAVIEHNAAYLKHWRDAIAKDNNLILSAATRAEKAYHMIVGTD
jgi:antirestriction protein ArdC